MPREGFAGPEDELLEAERQIASILFAIGEWMELHSRPKGVPEREGREKFMNLKLAIGFAKKFMEGD